MSGDLHTDQRHSDSSDPRDNAPDEDLLEGYWHDLLAGAQDDPESWLEARDADDDGLADQLSVLGLLFEARKEAQDTQDTQAAPSEAEPALCDGEEVGDNLTILGMLDAGGMGEVYLARHRTLQCEVVVKVLPPHLARNPVAIQQFQAGIRAQGFMGGHRHIVTTMDAGIHKEHLYLVMEYVPGINLGSYVSRNGPLSWRIACEYGRQAAAGLAHAHRHGVVHRDIKPSNLILSLEGNVKILDWGLAWLDPLDSEVTTPRGALGTHDYIAPEQARDATAASPQSDLYSLGATLYFLLTGRAPFAGLVSGAAKVHAHQNQRPVSPRQLRIELPTSVDQAVCRLLEKEPGDRFSSAQDVSDNLGRILDGKRALASRAEWMMFAIVALLLLTACGWVWSGAGIPGISGKPQAVGQLPTVDAVLWRIGRQGPRGASIEQFELQSNKQRQPFVAELRLSDGVAVSGRFSAPTSWVALRVNSKGERSMDEVALLATSFQFPQRGYLHPDTTDHQLLILVAGPIENDGADLKEALNSLPLPRGDAFQLGIPDGPAWKLYGKHEQRKPTVSLFERCREQLPEGTQILAAAILPPSQK